MPQIRIRSHRGVEMSIRAGFAGGARDLHAWPIGSLSTASVSLPSLDGVSERPQLFPHMDITSCPAGNLAASMNNGGVVAAAKLGPYTLQRLPSELSRQVHRQLAWPRKSCGSRRREKLFHSKAVLACHRALN